MAKCQITGAGPKTGKRISRRGKPKREGGVGLKTTGVSFRTFKPNLQKKRIYVPELDRWVTVRLTTRALKTINRDGAFSVLMKAGLVKAPRAKKKK
ncbi:MAG: large subunit ribosomal protein L28 [Planctomycetota bacterium]|jgi:large subunit ribosomal protein L28